jgi:hypothetical protein
MENISTPLQSFKRYMLGKRFFDFPEAAVPCLCCIELPKVWR